MKVPKGFYFNGLSAGIKAQGKKDLGIILSTPYASAVGFFTRNEIKSESLLLCKKHIKNGKAGAVIVNSGNANCAMGKRGIDAAMNICKAVAKEIKANPTEVLIASTGRIGVPLADKKITARIKNLINNASKNKAKDFAEAIMTTDRYPKYISIELKSGVRLLAFAKGAGMIEPNLATTLNFMVTDAKINRTIFREIIKEALDLTFNRISIDADMSTNDTFIALSNAASNIDIEGSLEHLKEFISAVFRILYELSYKIVENGEGATKVVKIEVISARSKAVAEKIARKIASSMLFKTSIYGNCANWGRIISSIGSLNLGVGKNLDIYYGKNKVVCNGVSLYNREKAAKVYLKNNKSITITIDLKKGKSDFWIYTTDLSPEYVRLNK